MSRSETYQVGVLRGEELLKWWPDISGCLRSVPPESLWLRGVGPDGILQLAIKGEVQVWAAGTTDSFQLFVISRLIDFEDKKVLKIEYAYGQNLPDLLPQLVDVTDACAEMFECESIVLVGRRGWERVLKEHGYEINGVILTKGIKKRRIN